MSLPHAVILAGGAGERLGGVRKANLRIGGVRLLDRIITAIGPVETPLLVSTGPTALPLALPTGAVAVADLGESHAGPLAGLVAALAHLQSRSINHGLLISVAVDTPFLPPDFLTRMIAGMGDAPAAYAAWGDAFYPTNALWRLDALPTALSGTHHSLKALQHLLGARRIDWSDSAPLDPFANLNTLIDLMELQRRAQA